MSWLKTIFGGNGPASPRHIRATGSGVPPEADDSIGGSRTSAISKPVHTFPKQLDATQCPNCGFQYSGTTFARQVRTAYPNPEHGELLKIVCSECTYVAAWVYRGEWD